MPQEELKMNKILKLLMLILAALAVLALASCAEIDENAPEGCVEISADGVGYNFYMVKDWTVMEQSGITSAKVSDFDTSNVSVMGFDSADVHSAEEYWSKYAEDFTAGLGELKYEEEGTDTTLCGLPAKKYIYTVSIGGVEYKFMQIVCYAQNTAIFTSQPEVYVFTYTARIDRYDEHIEDVIYMADGMTLEK